MTKRRVLHDGSQSQPGGPLVLPAQATPGEKDRLASSDMGRSCDVGKSRDVSRRQFLNSSMVCSVTAGLAGAGFFTSLSGCTGKPPSDGKVELIWGRRGMSDGRLLKPRAIVIDPEDRLFIVDMTGRIQVFDRDGNFQYGFETPAVKQGKPCGLGLSRDGNLLVADTHYFRVLVYTLDGELLEQKTIGGKHGFGPGEFAFVTDCVEDAAGQKITSEYGDNDRLQQFDKEGQFVRQWGTHGIEEGNFVRPQALHFDHHGHLWVADSCNHRLQVFDLSSEQPEVVRIIGSLGVDKGALRYPYGLALGKEETMYVCEFGNHRVKRITLDGETVGAIGSAGRQEGEFHQPWSLAIDSKQRLHVLDSYNHRVQRVFL